MLFFSPPAVLTIEGNERGRKCVDSSTELRERWRQELVDQCLAPHGLFLRILASVYMDIHINAYIDFFFLGNQIRSIGSGCALRQLASQQPLQAIYACDGWPRTSLSSVSNKQWLPSFVLPICSQTGERKTGSGRIKDKIEQRVSTLNKRIVPLFCAQREEASYLGPTLITWFHPRLPLYRFFFFR